MKKVETTMGPGAYSPERADGVTRVKTTNITMGTSPSRAELHSKATVTVGPGQYEDNKQFGHDTKTFTIGEKRFEKTVETIGPGAYDVDRADNITRVRATNINMGSSPSRGAYIPKGNDNTAPGQYDDGRTFGDDTKTFTIGEKRIEKVRETTMGPGAYSPERADGVTRIKTTNITMGTSPGRAELVSKTTTTIGPGEYEHSK